MANPIQPVTAQDMVPLTKSNTTVVRTWAALLVLTGGDVVMRTAAGIERTAPGIASGFILPVAGDKLLDATTASNVLALYY